MPAQSTEVTIAAGDVELAGTLTLPSRPIGIVVFAHGSGSSRFSVRNRRVAKTLVASRLGTLLFDLLTEDEERTDALEASLRFDIPLLASRLVAVTDWTRRDPRTRGLPVGLFGASTGAAAALITAAQRPDEVAAVVSRGGRPDLAGRALPHVKAPTLLIVGGADYAVLDLNRQAAGCIHTPHALSVVPHATHLFEEPGALDAVAHRAADFFVEQLGQARRAPPATPHEARR